MTSVIVHYQEIALKGRNTIVFSPHPSAVKCINATSKLIAAARQAREEISRGKATPMNVEEL